MECRTPGGAGAVNMRDKMVADARRGYDTPISTGPFLDTSGKRTRIIIPNPKRSVKLVKRMHAYEFTFKKRDGQWVRFTDQSLQGIRWSETHWMELAEKCYQEAYGDAPKTVTKAPKKSKVAKAVGRYLQRESTTGLVKEVSTLYQPKLFTEA